MKYGKNCGTYRRGNGHLQPKTQAWKNKLVLTSKARDRGGHMVSFRFMDAAVCTNPGTSDPEMLVAPVGDGFKYARGGHPSCIVPAISSWTSHFTLF